LLEREPHVNLPLKDNEVSVVTHAEELTLIHGALVGLRKGDATVKLPYRGSPGFGKVAEVFNDLVEQNTSMAEELAKLAQMVGKEGKLKRRASLQNTRGFWAQRLESINSLIASSARWRRVTSPRPWRSRSTAARSRASS
jgi:hypothetical protein